MADHPVNLKLSWDAGKVWNIMVLDGDPMQAQALKDYMRSFGCKNVQTGGVGKDVLDDIVTGATDIVIMDYETQGPVFLRDLVLDKPELIVIVIDDQDRHDDPVIVKHANGFLKKGAEMREGLIPMLRRLTTDTSAPVAPVIDIRPGGNSGY